MSVDFRIAIAVVALLSAAPLNGGQRHFQAASSVRDLATTQIVSGAAMIVGLEMASSTDGELFFRLGPFVPGSPLMLEHVDLELPTGPSQASAQSAP